MVTEGESHRSGQYHSNNIEKIFEVESVKVMKLAKSLVVDSFHHRQYGLTRMSTRVDDGVAYELNDMTKLSPPKWKKEILAEKILCASTRFYKILR